MTERNKRLKKLLGLMLVICVVNRSVHAQSAGSPGERRGPPPEAFEACAELSEGDSCNMTGRRGEALRGICIVPGDDDVTVVCLPENAPQRGAGGVRGEGAED